MANVRYSPLSGSNELMHQEGKKHICLVIPFMHQITVAMQSWDAKKKQKKTHFFFLLCAAWVKLRADWFAVSDLLHPDRKRICIDEKQIFDDICTKLTLSPTRISRAQRFWNSQSEVSAQLRSQHFFYQRTPIAKGSTSTQSKSDPLEGANLESPAWLNLRGKMSDFYLSNRC